MVLQFPHTHANNGLNLALVNWGLEKGGGGYSIGGHVLGSYRATLNLYSSRFNDRNTLYFKYFVLLFQMNRRVQILSKGRYIQIHNLQASDSGEYTCIASNPIGTSSLKFIVEIQSK